jgi:hypothetical protein
MTAKASEVNSISQVMCGEFQLSVVILIQDFLCSCDRNKSSKCYRRVHGEVYKGISWEDELCIKAFWWFCKAHFTSNSGAKGSHALAPVFKQTEGEEEGGGWAWCRRKVETICGNLFSTCVNLEELFLGSLWGEQTGTKHS